jgi:hypothetical protein
MTIREQARDGNKSNTDSPEVVSSNVAAAVYRSIRDIIARRGRKRVELTEK